MPTSCYQPSGRVSSQLGLRIVIAIAVLLPYAWIYAWATTHWNAFFKFFAPFLFYFLMVRVCKNVCKKGQVRNPRLMMGVALGLTSLALYFHWICWASMATPTGGSWAGIVVHLRNPRAVWELAAAAPANLLYVSLLALAEVWLLVWVPATKARKAAADPFCESSQTWPAEPDLPRRFGHIADVKAFTDALQSGPDSLLSLLPSYTPHSTHYTTLHLYLCLGAQSYVTVRSVTELPTADIVTQMTISTRAARQIEIDAAVDNSATSAPLPAQVPEQDEQDEQDDQDEQEDHEGDDATPEELVAPLASLHAGQADEALAGAQPYTEADNIHLRSAANRLCAMSCVQLQKWDQAAAYWGTLFTLERNAQNALRVATSKAMAGELSESEEWIVTSQAVNDETQDTTTIEIHTEFVGALKQAGYLRAAFPYLEFIKQAYEKAHSLHATTLAFHGLPLFDWFLEHSGPIVKASMDHAQAHAWYASMLPQLDQEGQGRLSAWLSERR